jgi:phosphoribosylformylglycinamidine synthase
VLEVLLDYGPARSPVGPPGHRLVVVPRPGTLSPWSSKATDIAHVCGLTAVRRIERGVLWHVDIGGEDPEPVLRALRPLVHDRMTEAVHADPERRLFAHALPAPFTPVDVLGAGCPALERANRELGSPSPPRRWTTWRRASGPSGATPTTSS